jgi:16S rRNA C967 or C1407 C5-methylase (RsmB/RsmF family)/NOL1/NOP2/fmu family ribosome biogenesis protein
MKQYIPLPASFIERVQQDSFLNNDLLIALDKESPTSIRLHPLKKSIYSNENNNIPWCKQGIYLEKRPIFTLDPSFHAGAYYPQEAGSMYIDWLLRHLDLPTEPVMLDLCAAPGGKSTLIASFLNGKGLLISNEIIHNRAKILKENMTKWGYYNSIVTNNEPSDFSSLDDFFDLILIDAPCSGEGMFRKDPNSRLEWSDENVTKCTLRQQDIVSDVWDSIKPGGYLIYSTCTFNPFENENNVAFFQQELGAKIVSIPLNSLTGGRNEIGYYSFPDKVESEGFYCVVLRKNTSDYSTKSSRSKKYKSQLSFIKETIDFNDFVNVNTCSVVQWSDYYFAVPFRFQEEIEKIHASLRVLKLGTEIGERSKKGIIPHEALAFSVDCLSSNINKIELTLEESLKFLKGETFSLSSSNQGFVLVTYLQQPLGWIKHLGNRFNNLYPKEWRIRMKIE